MNKLENIFSNKFKNNGSLFHSLNAHNSTIKIMLVVMFLVFMLSIQSVSAADQFVAQGSSQTVMQQALTDVGNGETVTFLNGTHTLSGNLNLANKNVTIKGEGNTTIVAGGNTFLVIAQGTSATNQRTVNIANLTINGTTGSKITIAGNNIVNFDHVDFINITGTSGRGIAITAAAVDVVINNSQFINISNNGTGSVSGKGIDATTAASSGSLKIYNTKFYNLSTVSTGSAINYYAPNSSYLYIDNSSFELCYGGSVGGVIRNYGGAGATINHTNFTDCRSTNPSTSTGSSHGGIFCFNTAGSYLIVDYSRFTDCYSASEGGVHYAHMGPTTISNTIFENCRAGVNGGAIYNNGADPITLTNVTFDSCYANTGSGGAIYAAGGVINLTDTRFIDNSAGARGGAINVASGTINIVNSNFTTNIAGTYGGAIAAVGGTINVNNSRFLTNHAVSYGGAIGAGGGTINVNNSYFSANFVNTSGAYGGALGSPGGTIVVYNSEFTGNNANMTGSFGGVAGVNGGSAVINLTNCNVHDNFADFSGAFGAGSVGGTINVINNTAIHDNHATTYGGVVGLSGPGTISIINSDIYNNDAGTFGGAFAVNGTGVINVIDSTIRNNTAGTFGGAVAVYGGGTITVNNSDMNDNTAHDFGGAAGLNGGGTINIHNSRLARNIVSAGYGGAVGLEGIGTINVNNSNLTNNRAATYGGAAGLNGNGRININASNLLNNVATTYGGAVGLEGNGNITIANNSSMNNNSATTFGGAVGLNGNGIIEIIEVSMFDNIAISYGGAVGVNSPGGTGTINVRKSVLSRNKATGTTNTTGYGGAIGLTEGNINVYDSTFENNTAVNYGGAVGVPVTGKFYANNSVFNNNVAGTYGGAIGSGAGVNISFCNFTENRAGTDGGAVAAMADPGIDNYIYSCQFEYNFAANKGYAIYALNLLTANYNRFFNNMDGSGNLNYTIETELRWPDVNVDFNWWGDNIPCAGENTPRNWVFVTVDNDTPIFFSNATGHYVRYTYTISLDGDPSTFGGFDADELPDFSGYAIFSLPAGEPTQEFDAHKTTPINVKYDENNRYITGYLQVDNFMVPFSIDTRIPPLVTVNVPTGKYRDTSLLEAWFTEPDGTTPIAGLVVNFYVGGVLVGTNTTNGSGYVSLVYTVASAGPMNYTAAYTGNSPLWGLVNGSSMPNFDPAGTVTTVTTDPANIIVNYPNNIVANVVDEWGTTVGAGHWVDFYIDGVLVGSNRTNALGEAVLSFKPNDLAPHVYSAIFRATANFTASTGDTGSINAIKMATHIVINNVTTKPFRNTRITVTLLDDNGDPILGKLIYYSIAGGSTLSTGPTDANGRAYIYYNASQAGNVPIFVEFVEDAWLFGSTQNGIIVVELLNTTVTFKNIIVNALTEANFIATLVDEDGRILDGETVEIYVDGVLVKSDVTDSNGRIYVDLGLLPVGDYALVAIFAGSSNIWAGSITNGTLEVRPINTTVPISVVQDENVSTTFLARLFDEFRQPLSGKPIIFYLDGNFIGVAVTGNDGIATLAYAYTPKGKITVEFLGDEIYRESLNSRAFGPNTIPFDQQKQNDTPITPQPLNNTTKNDTNKNNTNRKNQQNQPGNDEPNRPNKATADAGLSMLKAGNPIAMVLLCLISIVFTGFRRKRKN